jgi:hypothetical protein
MYMGLVMLGRQKYTAELLVPEPSALEVELAIEKLKSHKSPGNDQIPAELIKAEGRTLFKYQSAHYPISYIHVYHL